MVTRWSRGSHTVVTRWSQDALRELAMPPWHNGHQTVATVRDRSLLFSTPVRLNPEESTTIMTDPEPNHGSDSPALLPADDRTLVDAPIPGALTHFDVSGRAHMVDVGEKAETHRIAVARGRIRMNRETATVIREGRAAKGDVLAVAQIAAIMAAKKTSEIIPMCHPLLLTRIDVSFEITEDTVEIEARVDTKGQTGVEMEALTAVSAAGLTIYDMVKAIDRGMTIDAIRVEKKQGGRSGDWQRADQDEQPHEQPHAQLLEQTRE